MFALKLARILRGESLESVSTAIGIRKSSLSTAERFPTRVSRRIRKLLAAHYKTPWPVLSHALDGAELARKLLLAFTQSMKAKSNA